MSCKLKKDQDLLNHVQDSFFETVASHFDPHTNYFNLNMIKNFEAQLFDEKFSLGINYEVDNGLMKVTRLIPGGAAWKSGLIKIGDIILSISDSLMTIKDFSCSIDHRIPQYVQDCISGTIQQDFRYGGNCRSVLRCHGSLSLSKRRSQQIAH